MILGNSGREEVMADYCAMIDAFYQGERNVLVVKEASGQPFGNRQRIDVWWGG